MNSRNKYKMIKLRGLGYSLKEIADILGMTGGAIQYQLKEVKKLSIKEGVDEVFVDLVLTITISDMIKLWYFYTPLPTVRVK